MVKLAGSELNKRETVLWFYLQITLLLAFTIMFPPCRVETTSIRHLLDHPS